MATIYSTRNTTRYSNQTEAKAACVAGEYAAGHREEDGTRYFLICVGETVQRSSSPVRSERHVYTPSGKRNSSKALCGRVFAKVGANKDAFLAGAIALGVKATTARTMFSHYTVGRYAV